MAIKRIPRPMNFEGLSTDSKPTTGVPVLSTFIETNTGDKFEYVYTTANDGTKAWVKTLNQ